MNEKIPLTCSHRDPPWEPPRVVASELRRVDNLVFRVMGQYLRENGVEDVTPMHSWILGYLYQRRGEDVFQRDIEREFTITRSTVTSILQLMERKGYIERRSVQQDARLKRLALTPEGERQQESTIRALHQAEEFVAGLLTAEENEAMLRMLDKLYQGLKQTPAGQAAQ